MHKTTKLKFEDLNPHLLCVLCGGYFIEATAIIECLHSFCRSCITKYLDGSKCCPICDVQVHKTRPLLNLRPDKTLQTLVYKLVPGLYKKEMQRRREFYKAHPESFPSTSSPNACEERGDVDLERYDVTEKQENISLVMQHCDRLPLPSNDVHGRKTGTDNNHYTGCDRRYLLCPAAVTISHLKKFLRSKFDIKQEYQVELFYHGDETIPEDYTLADVAHLYGWTRKEPMRIFYMVLDTREVCLQLPSPTSASPIIVGDKREASSKKTLVQDGDVQPDPEPLRDQGPELCVNPADDTLPRISEPPQTPSPAHQNVASEDEHICHNHDEEKTLESVPKVKERIRKHSHKKKKKKKKHKRSRSKELSEEQRSVIKVRIPKDKICQSVFTGSLGLETPEDSHDEDFACSPAVPVDGKHLKRLFNFSDESDADQIKKSSDDEPSNSYDEPAVECMSGSKKTSELDMVSNLESCDREDSDNVSLNSSVCSSPFKVNQVSDSYLDKIAASPGATNDTTYCEDMSFFSDSEQDSSFENSQTSHKEYTCEISRDGKVLLHSAKSGNGNRKLLPSMDIVIEETPPQVIVVDKNIEMPGGNLSDKNFNDSFIRSEKEECDEDIKQHSSTFEKKSSVLVDKNSSIILAEDIEAEPSVLVEVDESGTLHDTSLVDDKPPPQLPMVDDGPKSSAPGSVSPSDGTCAPNEPMSSARTDAHAYQREKVTTVEHSGVPAGVHSSLSPPNGKIAQKRSSKCTDCGTGHKQPRLDEQKVTVDQAKTNGALIGKSESATISSDSRIQNGLSSMAKTNIGVHSSLSPPSSAPMSKVKSEKRNTGSSFGAEAHGHLDLKRLQYSTSTPLTTPIQAYRQSLQMMARSDLSSSKKSGNNRGPLKERPVTLPVSHATPIVKPCSPAPKTPIYGPVLNYPMFQPHIHPSLSAIAAQVQSQPHIPAPMKQLRLMCGEMAMQSALLAPQSLPQNYALQAPGYLPSSRHFLSPIFSPPLPARSLPSPLSPTRASPLSPNHFGPLSPAHFGPMSPPRHSPPGVISTHLQGPGYDAPLELTTRKFEAPLELTTRKAQDRQREGIPRLGTASATVTSEKR